MLGFSVRLHVERRRTRDWRLKSRQLITGREKATGPEQLQKDLADHGVQLGIHRLKRLRRDLALRCRQKRKFKATTNFAHSLQVADNLLNQDFVTTAPNQVWLTDITYIQTGEGWLYLAGHKDICIGEIVGYAMSSRRIDLVSTIDDRRGCKISMDG